MDLLKLNNEISGMRPFARQSTVHVIHQLTRKAAEFRKKNGPEEKKNNYQKRAEKYMQEALIDKVLVPDEIVKFSLQFDSSLRDKVLSDVSIPLSAKAFVRIAAHPSMLKAVQEFREKYPDWNKWLEKSLEKLGTGSRFGTKMKNGRVKAHLQQRQRVEEAIDTIRRAQMSWLHNSGKSKIKVQPEENKKSIEEEGEITNDEKAEENHEAESSDSSASKNNESVFQNNAAGNSESSDTSDSESEDSIARGAVKGISKPKMDSRKSKKADKDNQNFCKNLRPVVYEEMDENESESDEELEEEVVENKQKRASGKTLENESSALVEKEDSDSEENVSADDNQSEKSFCGESENSAENESEEPADESENSTDNESEESADESETVNKLVSNDEIDEKLRKKLLKKEKRKQKLIIPRSREVEVCKFSDLLKKEETRKIDEVDALNDIEDEDKPSKSPEKGVDPFFMTRNNDFLRIATAKHEAKSEEPVRKGPKWGIEGSENWTGTRQERRARARRMMGIPDPEGFSRRRGPPKLSSPSFSKQRGDTREALPVKNVSTVSDQPEDLHPSWAAKRKMNIASVGFQGKKVKFDDSD